MRTSTSRKSLLSVALLSTNGISRMNAGPKPRGPRPDKGGKIKNFIPYQA